MLGQVLDKLDAWGGRSFLLASLFPVLIFIAANAVMAQFLTPDLARSFVSYFSGGVYGPISATVACLAAAAAFAYVTDPLLDVMTKFLEGAYFPEPVAGWLATEQSKKLRDLEEAEQRAGLLRSQLAAYGKQLKKDIQEANAIGTAIGAMRNLNLVTKAEKALGPLERKRETQQPISVAELQSAAAALQKALLENCADEKRLPPDTPAKEQWYSQRLYRMYNSIQQLADYAHQKASNEFSVKVNEKQLRFAAIESPTEFGNYTAALHGFFADRFDFDFDFFWPIFQLVLQSDAKTADALTAAKQKLDLCIRVLMYTIAFTAIWLAVAAVVAEREVTVLLIGTGGLLVGWLWLAIIQANFRSLAEMIRSIVIVKRFDVLKQLHQGLPASWDEEKKLWKGITIQLLWGSDAEIKYQHPDK